MTDENEFSVTSPQLPTKDSVVRGAVDFSNQLTLDLQDSEIAKAYPLTVNIIKKWRETFVRRVAVAASGGAKFDIDDAMKLVDQFEDEIKTRLAEQCNLLVSVDVTPLLEGKGIHIVYEGTLPDHPLSKHGFDHERKGWEVKKSIERDEAFLGQKEDVDRRLKTKKRANG